MKMRTLYISNGVSDLGAHDKIVPRRNCFVNILISPPTRSNQLGNAAEKSPALC